jgi:hypothetical protein
MVEKLQHTFELKQTIHLILTLEQMPIFFVVFNKIIFRIYDIFDLSNSLIIVYIKTLRVIYCKI